MKNELGIEVKCDNCYLKYDCNLPVENTCRINGQHLSFMPSIEASSNRIKELQEQQFTEDELHIIINMTSILLGQDHSLYDSLLTPLSKKLKRMINER